MDADEFEALGSAVERVRQIDSWTNLHELAAATVEALWAILSCLESGVPTVQVEQLGKPTDRGRFPRPDWIEQQAADSSVVVITKPRDAFRMLRALKEGSS